MTTRTLLLSTFAIGIIIGAWVLLWASRDRTEAARAEAVWAETQQKNREASAPHSSTEPLADLPAAQQEIRRLRKELAHERELREQLTRKVEVLEERIALLQGAPLDPDPAAETDDEASGEKKTLSTLEKELDRFDKNLLEAEGFSATDVDWIRRRWELAAMQKLELADLRARGKRTPEGVGYGEIQNSMREDLGDHAYDAMLYATNQTNRVVVSSVLESSPAYLAGIRAGDVIYSYNDERVFKPMVLDQLTRTGERGETVRIEVLREGSIDSYWVERGPSGAHFSSAMAPPLHQ